MTLPERLVEQLTGDAARWHAPLNRALNLWNINTPDRVAMFLAQCAHESGGFKHLTENLHYSAHALLATWPNRFTPDEAVAMAYNEQAIAERAYGGRMGNGPEGSGDGYLYRGRGIIQLTGRENYRKAGEAIGIDLEGRPDSAMQPVTACQVAGWYWSSHGCNELADVGDYEGITRRINGGLNGLADRKAWLSKVRALLAAHPATQPAAPIEDRSTEYTPPASGITEPEKEQPMGATLLAGLIPSILSLFSGRAQAAISKATGASPEVVKKFTADMARQIEAVSGVAVTDTATAMKAAAVVANDPAKVAELEQRATNFVLAEMGGGLRGAQEEYAAINRDYDDDPAWRIAAKFLFNPVHWVTGVFLFYVQQFIPPLADKVKALDGAAAMGLIVIVFGVIAVVGVRWLGSYAKQQPD